MSAPVETTAAAVSEFLDLMESLGIRVWLDGGWAVDACLGVQTRRHDDLDIVIEQHDTSRAVEALRARGYRPVPRNDTSTWNFVLGHEDGRQVDFHVIVVADGDGVYGPPENGLRYPAEALSGTGEINGRAVACITPQWLVAFHTGYAVDATDWADVSALCDRFGIPIPDDYLPFR